MSTKTKQPTTAKSNDSSLTFRVNTPEFLREITENGARMGIFFVPMNVFQNLLAQVSDRAIKLNDPILNRLMFDLALYEEANPATNKD